MLSFAPAARTVGSPASIATAGSFCLFCENGMVGLALVTSASVPPVCAPAIATTPRTSAAISGRKSSFLICPPLTIRSKEGTGPAPLMPHSKAVPLPEAGLLVVEELEASEPLGALPEVAAWDNQPERPAVLELQRFAVGFVGDHRLLVPSASSGTFEV